MIIKTLTVRKNASNTNNAGSMGFCYFPNFVFIIIMRKIISTENKLYRYMWLRLKRFADGLGIFFKN